MRRTAKVRANRVNPKNTDGTGDLDEEISVAELPLEGAGARLLRAREARGLSRSQIATTTKIPERHLAAIEAGNFSALPGSTYAVGFSRSYARAVGLDEREIADSVREELAGLAPSETRRSTPAFEPGDPARVPSARFAWAAAVLALAVVVVALILWRGGPSAELPSLLPSEAPKTAASAPAQAAPATGDTVVFTAREPAIWVKFYDGAGTQLFQKELAQGESYTVPAGVTDVRLWTARPDALAITVGGQPVPPLATDQRMVKDVPVTAAALRARDSAATPATAAVSLTDPAREAAPRPRVLTPSQPRPASRPITQQVRPVEREPVPQTTSSPVVQPIPANAADR